MEFETVPAGQTIVVTRNGEPVAELRSVQPRCFASRTALAEAGVRMARIDTIRFRAERVRLDLAGPIC